MAKGWNRTETWVGLIVLGVLLLVLAIGGLFVYTSATAPTLHPNAQDVTSVTRATPVRQWADAVEPSGEETGYGLGWDLETVTLAGEQTRWVGHDGTSLGGNVASLMTFPERGLVVSVISNISYADTESLALKIAQAFAEQAPAPK